jgi:HK97 family phage prohead protease
MNRFKLIAESLKHKLENEIRSKKLETRTQSAEFEIRAVEGDGMSFSGYAAVFNSPSEDLGGFREFVAQGAFKRSLESRNRMMLLWNHDSSQPLASTRNGSLKLTEDKNGLFVEATLPNTQLGRDIAELIRTGTIDAMSFGFQVKRDSWSTDGRTRTLEDVSLHEVSLVSWPAYEGTAGSTAVRNYAIVAERMEIDAETLASAMFKFEQGDKLVAEEAQVIRDVLQKLSDEPEPEASPEMLTIKKKQFELLIKTLTQ